MAKDSKYAVMPYGNKFEVQHSNGATTRQLAVTTRIEDAEAVALACRSYGPMLIALQSILASHEDCLDDDRAVLAKITAAIDIATA
jgi:hypothetical protein